MQKIKNQRNVNSKLNNKTLNLYDFNLIKMDDDENFPSQCHPLIKTKKKKQDKKNETV